MTADIWQYSSIDRVGRKAAKRGARLFLQQKNIVYKTKANVTIITMAVPSFYTSSGNGRIAPTVVTSTSASHPTADLT